MARALDGFMPYFNAYTFVLSRQQEYEADRTATRLVGAAVNANGLVRDALLGRWIHQEFWPKLLKQADFAMQPAFMPFNAMRTAFKASHDHWATKEGLSAAWMERSGLHDTHPALRDRVEATGAPAVLPARVDVAAADVLLSATTTRRLIAEFDLEWWQNESRDWAARCKYSTRSRARLKELSALSLEQVPLQDLQEFALLKAEFCSPESAKPVLEHLLRQKDGPFPKAAFIYGRILLDEGNDRGLEHLEAAARDDCSLVDAVAHIGYTYQMKNRSESAAREWWGKIIPLHEEHDE